MIRVANDTNAAALDAAATSSQRAASGSARTARAEGNPQPPKADAAEKAKAADKTKPADKPEDVKAAVEKLNQSLEDDNRQVRFEIDPSSSRVITKVVDASTKEVLRQIPSEEVLRMAEALKGKESSSGGGSIPLVRTSA